MKKVIYCFSGTGNSLNAAKIIAAQIDGASIVSVKKGTVSELAADADVVGFICPVYEWDIPETMKDFAETLTVNDKAYTFMVATYIAVHGRCFETMDAILRKKGTQLHYGKALRCVASQCIAYEPFPNPRWMVPRSDRHARKIGRQIAMRQRNRYPRMGLCSKLCPCQNITMSDKHPVWNHACIGCNACVVYCPHKAIMFETPDAYRNLDNAVSRHLGLPDKRTRYHNPHISAKDIISEGEDIK